MVPPSTDLPLLVTETIFALGFVRQTSSADEEFYGEFKKQIIKAPITIAGSSLTRGYKPVQLQEIGSGNSSLSQFPFLMTLTKKGGRLVIERPTLIRWRGSIKESLALG